MQKTYNFSMNAKVSKTDALNKRFMIKRGIIDKIRRGLGKSVEDLSKQGTYLQYLVGRGDDMSPFNSAAAISKWQVYFDEKTTLELKEKRSGDIDASGVLSLLLEGDSEHDDGLINNLIVMSAKINDVELSPLEITTNDVDYEITDHPNTYEIECFLRPIVSPSSTIEDEKLRREKTKEALNYRFPLGGDPESRKRLSRSCGEAVKRHLIETATHHGLDTSALESSIFMVKAYWIAMPIKGAKLSNSRGEACTIVFQTPLELIGTWTAGSYRHKGMGLIKKASPDVVKKFKVGEFVL